MTRASGSRLGVYEILAPLGAGGMGEVYKARDTRLDRSVAIKVLAPALAADPQFRERFDREARAISALEHPHICALYDVGHDPASGADFLVMQYLEGQTLAERLAAGALPLAEAIRHSIEIASALDKAHTCGIVHRDLKPANVMLVKGTSPGAPQARLLDFGLAKSTAGAAGPLGASVPVTRTSPLTAAGTIVGTFQYMAPEQLEGRDADARGDIWAFGCLLYEMVSGHRAFSGDSQASLIGSILKDEPPRLTALQPSAPAALDHVVRRCLAKNPDERWQHIRDVLAELEWIAAGPAAPLVAGRPRRPAGRAVAWLAAGAIAGAAAGLAIAWIALPPGRAATPAVTRFEIATPPGANARPFPSLALSPDGTRVVFAVSGAEPGLDRLYVRALDTVEATPIVGTEGAVGPFFGPDGEWLAFFANGKLKKLRLAGGGLTDVADAPEPRGGAWGADGRIVFAAGAASALSVVPADGGALEPLTTLDNPQGEFSHRWPQILPDGRVVFTVMANDFRTFVAIAGARGGSHRTLIEHATTPSYLAGGYIVYSVANPITFANIGRAATSLMAVRLTEASTAAQPFTIMNEVSSVPAWGLAEYAAAPNGTIVSSPTWNDPPRQLVWVDRGGRQTPLPLPPRGYRDVHLSPDGRTVAVVIGGGTQNVWLGDTSRGGLEKLTDVLSDAVGAVWSPDGREIAAGGIFRGTASIVRIPIDRPSAITVVRAPIRARPSAWRAGMLLIDDTSMQGRLDVEALPLAGDRPPQPIAATPLVEQQGQVSPDGVWVAYCASGASSGSVGVPVGGNVYVRPVSGEGRTLRVSPDGGWVPLWSPDGRALFYQRDSDIVSVTFAAGAIGEPRVAATLPASARLLEISPDGEVFLAAIGQTSAPMPPLVVSTGALDRAQPRARR